MVCILSGHNDARPKMCFSLSPPPSLPETIFPSNLTLGSEYRYYPTKSPNYKYYNQTSLCNRREDIMQQQEDTKAPNETQTEAETSSDYKQWLHAMKLVARLPGGIPPEFRRKLWLSLADKYLKSKNVDWAKEEEKCFCEKWREDDEELGIQIVKDLHRTGSTLCTGPAGDLNQAKLKRILLGYARYNPEVGYCQGFNMLGALILQVMDKNESESIKVMIYLVEGILPSGYFCGSMGGLQADMAVFRELMQSKLPRLAKHLQKLQGPIENAYEPPLTNVFTMQWFLTMFCTCLPMSCVLRVWDLVLIEGSDVLLRTALALWSLLEERVLNARSADDFYGKMGSFSSELLNGHLIDSNGLIEKVVQLGPITDIQKLRDKHLYSIAPIQDQQELQLYYDDDEPDIDEDSRLAVATVWGIPWGRRGSQGQTNNSATAKQVVENKDRIALDISLLKKQYDKLRERQKQAHIILTTACSSASRPVTTSNTNNVPLTVNQLLSGRSAIITNKGRRNGPPIGAIPPARKPSLPAVLQDKPLEKQFRRGETLHWRDAKETRLRRDSLSWKEIKAERAAMISSGSIEGLKSKKIRSAKLGKSDSSSYSEESDEFEPCEEVDGSSTDTSLCDEESQPVVNGVKKQAPTELDKESSVKSLFRQKKNTLKQRNQSHSSKGTFQKVRPKSWAPSNEIPFVLMTTDSPNNSADENVELDYNKTISNNAIKDNANVGSGKLEWNTLIYLPISDDLENSEPKVFPDTLPTHCEENSIIVEQSKNKSSKDKCFFIDSDRNDDETATFDISNEGVTNEYFERVNSTERPTKLDLLYSLNEDENIRDSLKIDECIDEFVKTNDNMSCIDLLVDYSEKSSAACIEEAKTEISATFQSSLITHSLSTEYNVAKNEQILKKPKGSAEKRKDPRRLTLTRSSTMDIEKRYQALEKRLSMEVCSKYNRLSTENELDLDNAKEPNERFIIKPYTSNYNDNDINSIINENNICVVKKKIPSTADLEKRFKNIQQQLVNDRKQMLHSPCDSENPGKQSNSQYSDNIDSPTLRNENNVGKTRKSDDFDDEIIEDSKSVLSNSSPKRDSSSILVETEKAVLKDKDDIERRAVDIESDTKTSKSNTLQSKKEPPDLHEEAETSKNVLKESQSEISSEVKRDTDKDVHETNSSRNTHESEKNTKCNSNKEISHSNITNTTIEIQNKENQEHVINKSSRTSPPSTEELEKRFSALEEQMSSTKNASLETEQDRDINKHDKKDTGDANISSDDFHTTNCSDKKESLTTDLTKFKNITENSSKRRLSEPPSTEDLEKRYEVLKRRMSSRNFDTKTLHRERFPNGTQLSNKVNVVESAANLDENTASQHTPPKISPPSTETLEQRFEKLQNNSESKETIRKESPPSTENLEKRFEKLQSKNDTKKQSKSESEATTIDSTTLTEKSHPDNSEKLQNKSEQVETVKNNNGEHTISTSENEQTLSETQENVTNMNPETLQKTNDSLQANTKQIKIRLIEELQSKIKEHSNDVDIETNVKKKNALIDELKAKLKPLPNQIIKPTQISSNRPIQSNIMLPSQSFNDETLESHATSAYRKSGNYEPNKKMVRRFSDLPSRADLENRLQFLEEQLSKTVYMQRRSGDSEVASRSHYKPRTTFSNVPLNESLELRVQELEKRLNDNKTLSMDIACINTNGKNKNETEVEISQIGLATEAVTGKELVRYSSYGEVGDSEHQNPINISINIQMTLNKDDTANKNSTTDLDRRLQYLEEQLKSSRAPEISENKTESDEKNIKEEYIEISTNVSETDAKNNVEMKSEVKDSEIIQNILQNSKENESDSKLEQNIPIKESTEFLKKECHVEDDKLQETNAISDNCITEKDDLSQLKTIKDMENIKTAETKISDVTNEEKIVEKQSTTSKDQDVKAADNKNLNIQNTAQDTKSIERNENEDSINITNAHTDSQTSSKENINDPQPNMKINDKDKTDNEKCNLNESEHKNIAEANKNTNFEKGNVLSNTSTQIVPVEVNKKTLVLLLDNEPKAVKVRRLTRANTEELEDLFQALEKQLNDRSQGKTEEKIATHEDLKTTKEMLELAKEIENFSKADLDQMEHSDKVKEQKVSQKQNEQKEEEEFDWGKDPIKYHLKKRTVYLPSTKELEARFRSLERQIKLLEDVEKIDVEQRLVEIERKIKLQYSLSHEKDLNKFLELCEGKDVDEMPPASENLHEHRQCCKEPQLEQKVVTKRTSPSRSKEPIPSTGNIEYRYRSLDLDRSKTKQNLKKQPIHPLEMLLDPSPDESDIPTTGELEHRIRVMEGKRYTPPPSRKSHSQSPSAKIQAGISKESKHVVESTESPTEKGLPTAEELEARLEALEREQCFNFKMQKNFQQFNQKLKDVVSPSLSFDEFKTQTTKPQESEHPKIETSSTLNPIVSPKSIRFREVEKSHDLSLHDKEFTKSIPDSQSSVRVSKQTVNVQEGLGTMGIRLMRETSPLRRKGTHTGVPLRTGENINDQLTSIQNTIKSIDSLCEERPYRKEKCQQYIDALFSDSTYFAHKKTSLEDLTPRKLSRSSSREIGPSIRISDHSPAFSRSMGSADSIRSSSPLRSVSPLHYRSNRDLRREPSPRHRRDEDREEHESRLNLKYDIQP